MLMRIRLLSLLFLISSISITNAQSKAKKGVTSKKTTKKTTLVKETDNSPEIVDKQIVEEAPESNPLKVKYRRSSLYTMMIDGPAMPYSDSIKKYFVTSKIPDKFNNHNLETRIISKLPSAGIEGPNAETLKAMVINQTDDDNIIPTPTNQLLALLAASKTNYSKEYLAERKRLENEAKEIGVTKNKKIIDYINKRVTFDADKQQKEEYDLLPQEVKDQIKNAQKETNDIAKELVAKWFDRSPKGGFNMSLIKARGNYDASVLDIAKARASKRGLSMLGDAGEELIKNTFVLIKRI